MVYQEIVIALWGAVIILLVAGIFATGIFSTLKSGKEEKKDD